MRKEKFLDLVCEHLASLGAQKNDILSHRVHIDKYLLNLGIGDDSPELDDESPEAFAAEIYELIKAKPASKEDAYAQEPKEIEEEDIDTAELPEETTIETSVPAAISVSEQIKAEEEYINEEFLNELGDSLTQEVATEDYYDEAEVDATREFNVIDLPIEEYSENEDDYYEEDYFARPIGNTVFFWILAVILSPVWIALGIVSAATVAISFVFLVLFVALYIPILIALIIGGSITALAELIYSIIKLSTGATAIGLFEMGICFIVVALVISLSVLTYRMGTKIAPNALRKFGKFLKKLKIMLKKGNRKFEFYIAKTTKQKPYVLDIFATDSMSLFRANGGYDKGIDMTDITESMLISQLANMGATNFCSEKFEISALNSEFSALKFGYNRTYDADKKDSSDDALCDVFLYFNKFSTDAPPKELYRGNIKYTVICEIPYNLAAYDD
ncbi:MAG: hypothetical protein IKT56_05565, partial [Clostridia bacterium]|nr:hypothetical protein [Clostridia bacterium]